MSAIWAACKDHCTPGPVKGVLWRLVESQEQIATTKIVDTLDEQAVLEDMLDRTKPPMPKGSASLHYLLRTPFRYPPLRHGSRFGGRFEPSLFYGSLDVQTMLAESAYYRFLFLSGMKTAPADAVTSEHTAFTARYRASQGVRLQEPPFSAHGAALADPRDYRETQALGAALRAAGVDGFEFASARDAANGCNVALFTPAALVSRRPEISEPWACRTDPARVVFLERASRRTYEFAIEQFLVDGSLPQAAA